MRVREEKQNDLVNLGMRIRQIRKSKGFTQMGLAHDIGKDHPSINRLERGKINPSYLFLQEIANGLEVEVIAFFQNEPLLNRAV